MTYKPSFLSIFPSLTGEGWRSAVGSSVGVRLLLIFALLPLFSSAQQLQELRRSKYPVIYPEFKEARVNQPFGRHTTARVNFSLDDGALYFLDDNDKIRRAYVKNIISVEVDSTTFLKVDSIFGQVIATRDYNYLVRVTVVDKQIYGQENIDIATMMSMGGLFFKESILALEEEMAQGYPLKDVYYFVLRGKVVPARENAVKKCIAPEYKTAFKTLMGDRWWSWHDAKSLEKLFMYFPK